MQWRIVFLKEHAAVSVLLTCQRISSQKYLEDGFGRYPAALLWSVSTLISEIEMCQLFLGQPAAMTCPLIVLCLSPSYIWSRDDAAGHNWHRPQRAAAHVCTFDLLYMCACVDVLFVLVCVCALTDVRACGQWGWGKAS